MTAVPGNYDPKRKILKGKPLAEERKLYSFDGNNFKENKDNICYKGCIGMLKEERKKNFVYSPKNIGNSNHGPDPDKTHIIWKHKTPHRLEVWL